jgi:hypothetical protein
MVSVPERLADIDRELDTLGAVPAQLEDLIVRYRGAGPGVEEADEALWEIQQGVDIPDSAIGARVTPRPRAAAVAAEARAEAEKRQELRAELGAMVERQLGHAEQRQEGAYQQSEGQEPQPGKAGPALDEVSLFADMEADEGEVQQEPELLEGSGRPSQVDSDFKQVLQLDIDASVFPASLPPATRVEVSPAAGEPSPAGTDEAEESEGAAGAPEPEVDELDEDFLALLDEDVVELEDE